MSYVITGQHNAFFFWKLCRRFLKCSPGSRVMRIGSRVSVSLGLTVTRCLLWGDVQWKMFGFRSSSRLILFSFRGSDAHAVAVVSSRLSASSSSSASRCAIRHQVLLAGTFQPADHVSWSADVRICRHSRVGKTPSVQFARHRR